MTSEPTSDPDALPSTHAGPGAALGRRSNDYTINKSLEDSRESLRDSARGGIQPRERRDDPDHALLDRRMPPDHQRSCDSCSSSHW